MIGQEFVSFSITSTSASLPLPFALLICILQIQNLSPQLLMCVAGSCPAAWPGARLGYAVRPCKASRWGAGLKWTLTHPPACARAHRLHTGCALVVLARGPSKSLIYFSFLFFSSFLFLPYFVAMACSTPFPCPARRSRRGKELVRRAAPFETGTSSPAVQSPGKLSSLILQRGQGWAGQPGRQHAVINRVGQEIWRRAEQSWT